MAKVTEQDIIEHLKAKIKYHQNESNRIEMILSSFTVEQPPVTLSGNIIQKNSVGEVRAKKVIKAKKQLVVPTSYDIKLTTVKKIAFALHEIKEGYKEDIAAFICQQEPNSNLKKLSTSISGVLSSLKIRGLLQTKKDGRKDIFFLPL